MNIRANRQKAIEDVADFHGLTKLEAGTIDKIARSSHGLTIDDFPAIQRAVIPKMEYEFLTKGGISEPTKFGGVWQQPKTAGEKEQRV